MAQSQKNMREIIVQTNGLATETTLKTFVATASDGEIGVLPKGGETAAFGVPFVVARKTADGAIISDVIDPLKVRKVVQKAYAAEVQKVVTASTFPVPATAGDKYEYQVDIRLVNYGSLSVENFKLYHGHTILTQTSGPLTAEAAVDALVLNLNRNLSKEPGATATTNPLFTFARGSSGANSTLTITAKAQPLELGKKEGKALEFDVTVRVTKVGDENGTFGIVQPTVAVTIPASPGVGTGKQVANMEWFYRGNRGDTFRGLNFPYNWPTTTKSFANPSGTYDLIEVLYVETGDGLNQIELDKSLVIAVPVAQDADAVKAAIDVFVIKPDLVAEP
jgi:hypothetical protein